jgi:hypothetical protein
MKQVLNLIVSVLLTACASGVSVDSNSSESRPKELGSSVATAKPSTDTVQANTPNQHNSPSIRPSVDNSEPLSAEQMYLLRILDLEAQVVFARLDRVQQIGAADGFTYSAEWTVLDNLKGNNSPGSTFRTRLGLAEATRINFCDSETRCLAEADLVQWQGLRFAVSHSEKLYADSVRESGGTALASYSRLRSIILIEKGSLYTKDQIRPAINEEDIRRFFKGNES